MRRRINRVDELHNNRSTNIHSSNSSYNLLLMEQGMKNKKTRHEGDEGTVAFWLYMKALYKEEE